MAQSWYKRAMPVIKDVKPFLPEMAQTILKISGVKSVLLWGSAAKNLEDQNFVVRDIDMIAVTGFFSEDLVSINEGENTPLKLASEALEDEGFDPLAVGFTKQFVAIKEYNIDHWVISSDKKLLHWGPSLDGKEEWDELRKEAEEYAAFITKTSRQKLCKASQSTKDHWSLMYDHHVNKFLLGIPKGWFQSDLSLKDVLPETVKL